MKNKQPHILLKFASRSRRDKFFACLDNITELAGYDNYTILCTLDINDDEMNKPEVRDRIATYDKVVAYWGFSSGKINAINKDLEFAPEWDILMNHSDDMYFTKQGFMLDVVEAFKDYKGLVHFPDHKVGDRLITYAMMHREYYNKDMYIYNPCFFSVYADNWQQDVAKQRGLYKFVPTRMIEHRHHIHGYGPADELLKSTENPVVYEKDRNTYHELYKTLHTY